MSGFVVNSRRFLTPAVAMADSKRDQILEMLRLADVVPLFEALPTPPTSAIVTRDDFVKRWTPGGPWTDA